tara:strand:- start:323 stop:580 length:258 start_codon:yes stop_codon:yes gene_type:complete
MCHVRGCIDSFFYMYDKLKYITMAEQENEQDNASVAERNRRQQQHLRFLKINAIKRMERKATTSNAQDNEKSLEDTVEDNILNKD